MAARHSAGDRVRLTGPGLGPVLGCDRDRVLRSGHCCRCSFDNCVTAVNCWDLTPTAEPDYQTSLNSQSSRFGESLTISHRCDRKLEWLVYKMLAETSYSNRV